MGSDSIDLIKIYKHMGSMLGRLLPNCLTRACPVLLFLCLLAQVGCVTKPFPLHDAPRSLVSAESCRTGKSYPNTTTRSYDVFDRLASEIDRYGSQLQFV